MLRPLANPHFRNFWLGGTVGDIAANMWFLAASWVLLELTDSPLWVGFLGITAVPAIILSILGGGIADRTSKARLLILGAGGYSSVFLLTALLVQLEVHNEWQILGLSLVLGAFWAFQSPALKALVLELVDRRQLVTANALAELSEFAGEIAAPLVTGFLIASSGVNLVFWLALSLILVELAIFARLPRAATNGNQAKPGLLSELRSGLRYMRSTPPFTALLIISISGLFGSMLIPLIPVVARDVLDSGASGFGILSAAFGAGLAAGSIVLLVMGERGRKVTWLVLASTLASGGIAAFAYSDGLGLAAAAVFAVGAGTAISGNMVVTLFQVSAAEGMRGRAMGVYSVTSAMVPLGSLIGGWLGAVTDVEFALVASAVATALPVLLAAVSSPTLRRL